MAHADLDAAEVFLFKCNLGHLLLKIWRPHLHKSLKYTFQRQSLQMSLRVVRSCMKCFPQQNLPRSICCQTSSLDSATGIPPNEHLVENGALGTIRKSGNLHIWKVWLKSCHRICTSGNWGFNKQLQLQAPQHPFRPASLVSGWNWNSLGSAPAMAIWQRIQLTKTQEMIRFSATPLSYKYELSQLADFFLPDLPLAQNICHTVDWLQTNKPNSDKLIQIVGLSTPASTASGPVTTGCDTLGVTGQGI